MVRIEEGAEGKMKVLRKGKKRRVKDCLSPTSLTTDDAFQEQEELADFQRLATNAAAAALLRLLIQRPNADLAADIINQSPLPPLRKIHADYHRLLRDDDLLQFGVSRCRLPISAIHDFILCTCLAFPSCLPDRLPAIAKFTIWIFSFDDRKLLGADPDAAATFVSTTLRSLSTFTTTPVAATTPCSSTDSSNNTGNNDMRTDMLHDRAALLEDVAQGAASCWAEFRRLGMHPAQQHRFLDAFQAYGAAIVMQTRYNSSGTLPADPLSFSAMRADASAVICYYVLFEFSRGVDVMSELRPEVGGVRPALEALQSNLMLW